MEVLYQVFSLIWTYVQALSNIFLHIPYYILLNGRILANPNRGSNGNSCKRGRGGKTERGQESCWMYKARVHHSRTKPVQHAFSYNVRIALIDLDDPPKWYDSVENDTMTGDQARDLAHTTGNVMLLTHPSVAGYRQNPISVYYCYDTSNTRLEMCIAEVTNTPWGDRVTFLFRPDGEQVPKSLHVSPLMDMENTWCLKTKDPCRGDRHMYVKVAVTHPVKGDYFCAIMTGELDRVEPHQPNETAGFKRLLKYGFQPQRIALWIYWHALLLLWKGVSFYPPPSLKACQAARSKARHPVTSSGCPFIWRPAQEWPWISTEDSLQQS